MQNSRIIMGMPITVAIADAQFPSDIVEKVFAYFTHVDEKFSTYKPNSEISKFNKGIILPDAFSQEMKEVFELSEKTKQETNGYFDIQRADGTYDPSGLVKGWAVQNAAQMMRAHGVKNFYVEAGGDIQVSGKNAEGQLWRVGIRNPFNEQEIIKVLQLENCGIATSGTYVRGGHIYNPHARQEKISDIVSMTVVASNVYEADRFATAAFAMGKNGIAFIGTQADCEGYMVATDGTAVFTDGFSRYVI